MCQKKFPFPSFFSPFSQTDRRKIGLRLFMDGFKTLLSGLLSAPLPLNFARFSLSHTHHAHFSRISRTITNPYFRKLSFFLNELANQIIGEIQRDLIEQGCQNKACRTDTTPLSGVYLKSLYLAPMTIGFFPAPPSAAITCLSCEDMIPRSNTAERAELGEPKYEAVHSFSSRISPGVSLLKGQTALPAVPLLPWNWKGAAEGDCRRWGMVQRKM